MKKLIEFPLEDGNFIVIEVDDPDGDSGLKRVSRPGEIADRSSETFEKLFEK
jgi:hypothetical protein